MTEPKGPVLPTSSASPFTVGDLESASLEERFTEGGRPVIVASYPSPIEAELVKSRLEADGISADLLDVHTSSMGGPLALAVGGVKVRVLEDDVERAHDVIAGIGVPSDDVVDEEPEDDPVSLAPRATPDALAQRALVAGIIGTIMLPPLGLYSLWLVWRAVRSDGELTKKGKVKTAIALGFDALSSLWLIPFL